MERRVGFVRTICERRKVQIESRLSFSARHAYDEPCNSLFTATSFSDRIFASQMRVLCFGEIGTIPFGHSLAIVHDIEWICDCMQ